MINFQERSVCRLERCRLLAAWIANHPHVSNPNHYSDVRNTLYIAERVSKLRPNSMGGGVFSHAQPIRRLTAPGKSRSAWLLPPWFYPVDRTPLSYHGSLERGTRHSDGFVLNSVAKGQEFVLGLAQYPEANAWLKEIVGDS